jgi:Zn finger protein HypA/HybF involved in hydrogenase expression
MHESGLIQSLLRTALAEASRREAELTGIEVRLGVLAGGSPEHLREHFELEISRLGLAPITLNITADPDHPGGVEIVGVELRGR